LQRPDKIEDLRAGSGNEYNSPCCARRDLILQLLTFILTPIEEAKIGPPSYRLGTCGSQYRAPPDVIL
jgi:hypothetical protein